MIQDKVSVLHHWHPIIPASAACGMVPYVSELKQSYSHHSRQSLCPKPSLCSLQTMHPRVLVVHFHTDTGMSNRMGVLVSALALAIATDRALLMDWPPVVAHWHPAREYIALPSVEQLLEPPVGVKWRWSESRNWLPPSGGCNGKHATASNCLVRPFGSLESSQCRSSSHHSNHVLLEHCKRGGIVGNQEGSYLDTFPLTPLPFPCLQDLQNPLSLHFGALLCGELDTATPDPRFKVPASGDVLHLQSWDFFLPLIKNNPTISPRLAPLGPEPASTLARWLLRPVPPLEDQAQGAFMHDLAGHFVVGIHIRMQGYNGVSAKQVTSFGGSALLAHAWMDRHDGGSPCTQRPQLLNRSIGFVGQGTRGVCVSACGRKAQRDEAGPVLPCL